MERLIRYFTQRHLLINVILFSFLIGAVVVWDKIGKEEMPDFARNFIRFSIRYPGAAAEDVELFVTRPIEERLKGVSGLHEVGSTSSFGNSSIRVTLDPNAPDPDALIQDVKDAVDRTNLPRETEDPVFSRFSSAEKAIIDIALYHTGSDLLDVKARTELQEYALAFETQLLTLPQISSIERNGYLRPEIQIKVDPERLMRFNIPLSVVRDRILAQHVRLPAGTLEDKQESEISILSELETPETLREVIVRGGFEGNRVRLRQVAEIENGFERTTTITKIQGHEGILFNVKKTASSDILSSQKAIVEFVNRFRANNPDAPIGITLIDDESYDVRNRLSLVSINGVAGFVLIAIVLFIFLDFKSGVWVAMGIPFTLAFTLMAALLIGYTVNNITLAAIIIVLGIVVDDAIIVAENISRLHAQGMPLAKAAVQGTTTVIRPIVASILTTCAAFVPLYFFTGRFGMLIQYIPIIVFLMLGASLLESAFILPGHLARPLSGPKFLRRLSPFARRQSDQSDPMEENTGPHWFFAVETRYRNAIRYLLERRTIVLSLFLVVLVSAGYVYSSRLKFVMFPREEASEITIRATAARNTTRREMARLTQPLEKLLLEDEGGNVTSVITQIGQNRRGSEARENEATLRAELLPPDDREVPLNRLIAKWEKMAAEVPHIESVRFMKSRFGSDSGSPIEIEIQENNDGRRQRLAERLAETLRSHPALSNIEIERPVSRNEYRLVMNREQHSRLGIDPGTVASTLRAYLEGHILYTLNKGDEEVDVRLTSLTSSKDSIENVLALRTANAQAYLVPYSNLVEAVQGEKPANIQRVNYKRTTKIFADLRDRAEVTPLEIAEELETSTFPAILKEFPSSVLKFRGEVEDSRESQGDFALAIFVALGLIYILLIILYDSLTLPLLIGATIPFGAVGVILTFWLHGMEQYGFFAVIGALGMLGVVVNDAIIMVSKFESDLSPAPDERGAFLDQVARLASTRLRAVVVTTLTTVAGLFPTAYGWAGYDSMLAEMMLAMAWGLLFGTAITLLLVPCIYSLYVEFRWKLKGVSA